MTYARFCVEMRYEDLPQAVIQQGKMLLLDLLGVSLAGYGLMEFPRTIATYLKELGGRPEATIFQTPGKFPAVHAAMANAACAHALDMDDGHRFAASHPGTVVIPAALAAAEMAQASTRDLLAGIVAGYEVMIRLSMAINPSSLNRGFHATGITGAFGAAGAAARILGLSTEEAAGGFGLAGLQASGVLQVNHDVQGAKVKPINPARAASSGILAAVLAQRGARGPLQILEGEDGLLRAVADNVKANLLTEGLGEEYEILRTYLKLHAACRHAHAPLDAALAALRQVPKGVSDIQAVVVETYPAAVRLAGIPHATTPSAGKFSIPFSVALLLHRGSAGAADFNETAVADTAIQELARKVELRVSPYWEQLYPEKRGAMVTLITREGRSHTASVDLAKGEPENPATWEEILDKFRANARVVLSDEGCRALGDAVLDLENRDLTDVVRWL